LKRIWRKRERRENRRRYERSGIPLIIYLK